MSVKVATEDDLRRHEGADLVDFDKVKAFWCAKVSTLRELKTEIAAVLESQISRISRQNLRQNPDKIRMWPLIQRPNGTMRPQVACRHEDDEKSLSMIWNDVNEGTCQSMSFDLKFFAEEISSGCDIGADSILFLKFYSPETCTLEYLSYLSFNGISSIPFPALYTYVLQLKELEEPICAFNEDTRAMIEGDYTGTVADHGLGSGDILVFQTQASQADEHEMVLDDEESILGFPAQCRLLHRPFIGRVRLPADDGMLPMCQAKQAAVII